MTYYMKFDSEGYIVDLTCLNPNDPEYTPLLVQEEIPAMIMRGYYKWDNGFVLDVSKQATLDAIYNVTLTEPLA